MENQISNQEQSLPYNFDPTDPSIWVGSCYGYDEAMEPDEHLYELGFTQAEFLAIAWLSKLRGQVTRTGLSLFVTVDGRHRSGKSRGIVTIACLFSNEFRNNMKKYIVRDADQLLNLIEEIDSKKIKNPVIIIDEAAKATAASDWFEAISRCVIKTMSVLGYLHPTIFFLAPLKGQILSGIRNMSHVHIKVTRSSNNYSVMVPYEIHMNTLKGKVYFKKFRITLFGQPKVLDNVRVSLPPKDIDTEYDNIEKEMKPVMLRDIREDSLKSKIKESREVIDYDTISEVVLTNFDKFSIDNRKGGRRAVNAQLIRTKFRLGTQDSQAIQAICNKKLAEEDKIIMKPIEEKSEVIKTRISKKKDIKIDNLKGED